MFRLDDLSGEVTEFLELLFEPLEDGRAVDGEGDAANPAALWMFFFWEVTTLCSFFLIGYTKTEEAINNSFRALTMNLLGGLAFVLAIIVMGNYFEAGTVELSEVLEYGVKHESYPKVHFFATFL